MARAVAATEADVPILDLAPFLAGEPGALDAAARRLRHIGEAIGFHYIAGHGIGQDVIDAAFRAAAQFHDQPLAAKLALKVDQHLRGYLPMQASTTRSSDLSQGNKPNRNEAFFVGREIAPGDPDFGKPYRGANRWPVGMPGFRAAALAYFDALDRLVSRMLPLYAAALDLPADFFAPAFRHPLSILRMTHYPPADYEADEYGIAPHTDSSFITLLAQNRRAGLQIRLDDGRWVDAPAIEGTFVVNSGDMLRRWTNHRFRSTPHRASNREGGARYAIPFFVHPDPDHPMACLPTCCGPDNPARYGPETAAGYLAWFAGRNYDHVRAQQGIRD